jgi:hypothetical protein
MRVATFCTIPLCFHLYFQIPLGFVQNRTRRILQLCDSVTKLTVLLSSGTILQLPRTALA